VGIILLAGIYGGIVNYFTLYNQKESGSNRKFCGAILAGVAASFMVPLFLSMISSDLIENSRKDDKYYFVFAGLCLVAGIFSRRFINSIGKKILDQVEKANEKINQVEAKNKEQVSVVKMIQDLAINFLQNNSNQPKEGKDEKKSVR
jgi:ABC-type siderophore export system fused ATPase/permease subunit